MMLSKNLNDWKSAMQMRAITQSNFTYADGDGNIFYIWNGTVPDLEHPSGGDTSAIELVHSSDVWKEPVPFDSLPQLLNPDGGYLHNENDPFHFTNLHEILLPDQFPDYFPEPRLRQRSQHSILLIDNSKVFSLEDIIELKHSMRMLLADQVKDDLVSMVRASKPKREIKKAIDHIAAWDNSVHRDSRGGVLFRAFWVEYIRMMKDNERYKVPWSFEDPMNTPRGLADADTTVAAFHKAVTETKEKFGKWDMAWGEIHRLRHGDYDLPASGGTGGLGCFRVLWYEDTEDGKRQVRGGDGWQFAVEFSDPPKAYSILAYGQSNDPGSPHHADQVEMFNNSQMKRVAFTEKDISKSLIRSYRPGEE
jgi:acyl-homoserine-lactone acylase